MVKLTNRLLAAASLVRGGGIVADIGTDHAYLPIYLLQNSKVTSAIAADIGIGPLENAEKSVVHYNLKEKIELRLSDGLKAFSPEDAAEFVFAGMGGTLITEILDETPWIKNGKYHFVFQPQSRAEELRAFLYGSGFEINREIAVCEGKRVYIAFDAFYTGCVRTCTLSDCYIGKLTKTPESVRHIQKQLHRLEKRYSSGGGTAEERAELSKTINSLNNFINSEDIK